MGHRDFKTTLIYADYQPSEREAEFVERAFGDGPARVALLDNGPNAPAATVVWGISALR
jgi:hypothetical protein